MKSVKEILSERARKRVMRFESIVAKKLLKENVDPEVKKVAEIIKASGFMSARSKLEKAFGKNKVDFSYQPEAHWSIKTRSGNVMAINKKYAEDPEMVVGDIAVGRV